MLVLSRLRNERIIIELPTKERIVIKVADIRGDKVRIGIEAPRNFLVHREEVYEAIKRETLANGTATGTPN